MKKMFLVTLMLFATAVLIPSCVASEGSESQRTSPKSADELAIGADAPKFSLVNTADGKTYSFTPGDGKPAVVVFTCNHCPYSKAFENRIVELGREYGKKGIAFYAVNPNDDVAYPSESADKMKDRATTKNYPFPYLKDGDSEVARAYGARVTPHVFLVDARGKVAYRGYVDDSAKSDEREHEGLSEAMDALLAEKEIQKASTKAFGCTIKWKS